MAIDPAIISSMSALLGAVAGGGASLAAAVYTQRYQDRLQRIARESTKREAIYAEFIMTASAALLNAYGEEGLSLGQDKQQLVGVLQRIRLFAPPAVVVEAERVMRAIVEIALQPVIDFRGLTAANWRNGASPISLMTSARSVAPTWTIFPIRSVRPPPLEAAGGAA